MADPTAGPGPGEEKAPPRAEPSSPFDLGPVEAPAPARTPEGKVSLAPPSREPAPLPPLPAAPSVERMAEAERKLAELRRQRAAAPAPAPAPAPVAPAAPAGPAPLSPDDEVSRLLVEEEAERRRVAEEQVRQRQAERRRQIAARRKNKLVQAALNGQTEDLATEDQIEAALLLLREAPGERGTALKEVTEGLVRAHDRAHDDRAAYHAEVRDDTRWLKAAIVVAGALIVAVLLIVGKMQATTGDIQALRADISERGVPGMHGAVAPAIPDTSKMVLKCNEDVAFTDMKKEPGMVEVRAGDCQVQYPPPTTPRQFEDTK